MLWGLAGLHTISAVSTTLITPQKFAGREVISTSSNTRLGRVTDPNLYYHPMIPPQMMAVTPVQQALAFIFDGLSTGFILALLGLGITLVFGLGGVLNLSLGNFAVIAATATVLITEIVGNILLALATSIIFVAALGLTVDRSLLSLVYLSDGEERTLTGIFTMLGLAIVLDGIMFNYFPSRYSIPLEPGPVAVMGVTLSGNSLLTIGVSVVLISFLFVFFEKTYLGGATRTVMQDETGAVLCGINLRLTRTLIFMISAVIAAIAGILFAISASVSPTSSFNLTVQALIVSIAGGVTSISGTIIAGLILGIVSNATSSLIGSSWSNVVLFCVVIGVIMIRPGDIA
jgi:branched-chain amino acid transport system permease protein